MTRMTRIKAAVGEGVRVESVWAAPPHPGPLPLGEGEWQPALGDGRCAVDEAALISTWLQPGVSAEE